MTTEQLLALAREIDELAEKATPGPWFVGEPYQTEDSDCTMVPIGPFDRENFYEDTLAEFWGDNYLPEPSAKLVVTLRNAAPTLTQALRALARAREALAFYADNKTWHGRVGDKNALLEPVASDDSGKRARAALAAIDEVAAS